MPTVRATLARSPVRIMLEGVGVPPAAWSEIAARLSEQRATYGDPLPVLPDAFFQSRRVLQGILSAHRLTFEADADVQDLLRSANADEQALRAAFGETAAPESLDPALLATADPHVMRKLRPFQLRDLARLLTLRHGANFSVPGAGKTTVTLSLHALLRARGDVGRMIVVAPLSAFDAWEEDAAAVLEPPLTVTRYRQGRVADADVILVNYQRLASAVPLLTSVMLRDRVHLVVDEAHRSKRGPAGEWGRAIGHLAPLASRRDILTGTPAPNHPRDLVALLDVVWPDKRASSRLPSAALRARPTSTAMSQVNEAIHPLFVRTTKSQLDLPPVQLRVLPVDMGPLQADIYAAMLRRYAGMFDLDARDAAALGRMGDVAMHLLQAASSPRLLRTTGEGARAYTYPAIAIPAGSRLAALVESYSEHEMPAKIAAACRLVLQNAELGRKTLLWSNFPDNLLDLEQQLAALQPALVYGAIPSADGSETGVRTREGEVERFRNDPACMVLLANPAAMSEGISLHRVCHDAIYVERTFNAGQYLQSLDRIHRLGLEQDDETRVTLLVSRGTIDERVGRRVEEKTRALAAMLADPGLAQMALPDDEDPGLLLDDARDLVEVLDHLRSGGRAEADRGS
ncbi:DEAD/DEAH box helicase [Cellulomonas sp. FA1]|uniref:DEAD/DEAH box helicase n=1 Tax=Cellulomonas sp. FA1 TaxID=1346710 RepID=UPI00069AF31E|nr:DEAD/DEAH box helicase [Cellulomonas sp. FA1]